MQPKKDCRPLTTPIFQNKRLRGRIHRHALTAAGKTSEQIELLQLDKSAIKVAEHMTELPKRKLLEQKLHKAVVLARKRLEAKSA